MAEKLELFLSAQEPLSLEAFQTTIANGKDGITFVPHINNEGILSWTNDYRILLPLRLRAKMARTVRMARPAKMELTVRMAQMVLMVSPLLMMILPKPSLPR